MAINMCEPKSIQEITIDDLKCHRWCFYHNDDEGFDAFEYVIPDSHPDFSTDVIELELAEFTFSNGKIAYGLYDGSESFNIMTIDHWYSFWYGVSKPNQIEIDRISHFLAENGYQLPVEVVSKWSQISKKYDGIQYINSNGETVEVSI